MNLKVFLEKYITLNPRAKELIDNFIADWGADFPNVMLLAHLGRQLVKQIEVGEIDACKLIFELIEEGILHGDAALQNSCATGFLEAVAFRLFENEILYCQFLNLLGIRSKMHVTKIMNE